MKGVELVKIKQIEESRGTLCPIHLEDLPFEVKRMFYVYNVDDQEVRGKHAHFKTKQILICLKGECIVTCKDGFKVEHHSLNHPGIGLFIDNMLWDEQVYKSKDTILLVLSSTLYEKSDYIVDWEEYLDLIRGKK